MEIQYLGHSCFRIKGKKSILVTDPFEASIGYKLPNVSADIITVSHQHEDHNHTAAVKGTIRKKDPFVISGPGEYEIAGVFIFGLPSFHDRKKGQERGLNTIYMIIINHVRLVHLGDLGTSLSDEQLEEINGVDVLFVPVGGTYTLGPKEAAALVNKVQPKIVIPMHYQAKGIKLDLKPVDDFLSEIGSEVKPVEKLVVTKESLPDEREVVVLRKKG